ncbi:MAG: S24 family peptidase [Pseudomonadota bacterium]|nr:S24 family peptidase [Pseudomonadota bacterium]
MNDARATLQRLCSERGESLAGLSRLLGRNDAYIQQYLRKGTPRRLPERERRTLARYFGVTDAMLGGPAGDPIGVSSALVPVRRSAVRASAGAGALAEDQSLRPYFAFDPAWLRALTAAPGERLTMIRVEGDSMAPTLNAGDDILVDHDALGDGLRDGIYVLRVDEALLVKRLAIHPFGGRVTVQSDNPNYPDWPDRSLDELTCIGRVIWAGRRIS